MTSNSKTKTKNHVKKDTIIVDPAPKPQPIARFERQQKHDERSNMMSSIARAAADPDVDVDKMERLLQMHRQLVADEAELQFAIAMNRLQPTLPVIKKNGLIEFIDRHNQKQHTPYALREDIEKAIRPFYTAHGFSTEYNTEYVDGKIVVILTVRHSGGHKEVYRSPPMPYDTTGSKNNNQAAGSTFEYGKRQTVSGAFNIITEGQDDDGAAGGGDGKPADKMGDRVKQEAAGGGKAGDTPDAKKLEEAGNTLIAKLDGAKTPEKRGEIFMANVKIVDALMAAGFIGMANSIRAKAEGV